MAKYNTLLSHRSLNIVHTESSCGWGGQEIRILEESRGLIERGHNVTIICPAEATIFTRAHDWGVKTVALPITEKRWANFRALRSWLIANRIEVDVVNTHSSTDSWLVALANMTFGSAKIPVVRTRHISAPVANTFANRWLYGKAAQHIVTTGESLRHELIDGLGLSPDRVQSIFTGINTKRYIPGDKVAAREKLGLEMNCTWVGIVATLRSWKGHKYLLDSLKELNDPNIRLAIVGDGPQREKLQQRVIEHGLVKQVYFAGNQRDVVPWLQAFDIFVLPSYANEGVSQAVMQAMAVGLPVITTPIGSSGDIIKPGMTGLMVTPKSSKAISQSIRKLVDDPREASRIGEQARSFAVDNCGIDRMLTRMEAVFQRASG
ncbi:glycosyltransferase family 4 protein [Uliginosibacterium gangwonense]|uniref:glycosyltransferase family 4 protein n=1 Tax=Uliginosibacterium gangwonense TaxID=392736 RepID=UPI00036DB81E|nr:glycosyltransferase family 4 protein [Uliginosibacterium gangwonense]